MYMTGFFPVMMFGLPAAALAMYHTAKNNRKKVVASFVDWFLSFKASFAENPLQLLAIGLVFVVVYYIVFRFVITKFNLKTPGREDDDNTTGEMDAKLSNNNFTSVAETILKGLGRKENIVRGDNCITRLRLEITDHTLVNEKIIKSAGVAGIIRRSKTNVQVIVGTQVQFVADEFKKLCKNELAK